jgi:hypothetical protein
MIINFNPFKSKLNYLKLNLMRQYFFIVVLLDKLIPLLFEIYIITNVAVLCFYKFIFKKISLPTKIYFFIIKLYSIRLRQYFFIFVS